MLKFNVDIKILFFLDYDLQDLSTTFLDSIGPDQFLKWEICIDLIDEIIMCYFDGCKEAINGSLSHYELHCIISNADVMFRQIIELRFINVEMIEYSIDSHLTNIVNILGDVIAIFILQHVITIFIVDNILTIFTI